MGQRGAVAGVEGFLDVLAGDLVAAGYAVCIDGEQDADAVPAAGSDLGGRGTGGQPQRQPLGDLAQDGLHFGGGGR
jgi:hypothetical protein